uniref:Uncharacterized protein n=1 Tax=Kalmanozyma brasiliensis (strain GHG001) TaxID=1365824 RepID=V5GNW9_KALBG
MTTFARLVAWLLLATFFSFVVVSAEDAPLQKPSRLHRVRKPPTAPFSGVNTVAKRGIPGRPGDIEWMGFYGSLLAVPTMLSILGIQTNYNLEKSYFNSQLNAQYYKQSRELLRAHALKLTRDQEMKFAKAGYRWPGMIWDADGNMRVPGSEGSAVGVPTQEMASNQDRGSSQVANGASDARAEGSAQGVGQGGPGTVLGPGEGGSGYGAGAGRQEAEKPIEAAGAQGAGGPGADAAAIGRAGGNAQDAPSS